MEPTINIEQKKSHKNFLLKNFKYTSISFIVPFTIIMFYFSEVAKISTLFNSLPFFIFLLMVYGFTFIICGITLLWFEANQTKNQLDQLNVNDPTKKILKNRGLFINLNFLSFLVYVLHGSFNHYNLFIIAYFILCIANITTALFFGYKNQNVWGQVIISILFSIFMLMTGLDLV